MTFKRCPSCKGLVPPDVSHCPRCGTSALRAREVRPPTSAERRRQRLLNRVIAGAVVVLVIDLVYGLLGELSAGYLLAALVHAAVLGPSIALVCTWRGWGMHGGALAGALCGAAYLVLHHLVRGVDVTTLALVVGAFTGAMPGLFIGLHIQLDR